MHQRYLLLGALSALLLSGGASAATSSWPATPITLVIAYSSGGTTDIAGRLLAAQLTKTLGQQVIVQNRPGAGGTIGASYVARSKPDGYTLLLAASPEVSIAPVVVNHLSYDPLKDLAPVSMVGKVPFILAINPDLPIKTLQDLIDYAKKKPGELNYSSFGTNTSNHLMGEQFKLVADVDATHIPYKGSGPAIADLLSGQVQFTFDTATATLPHVNEGTLRALAVATTTRLSNAPAIPTMSEAGLPGFVGGTWFGLLAPANTPQSVIDRLSTETRAALSSPELKQRFQDLNITAAAGSPGEFQAFIDSEISRWRDVASKVGIKAE